MRRNTPPREAMLDQLVVALIDAIRQNFLEILAQPRIRHDKPHPILIVIVSNMMIFPEVSALLFHRWLITYQVASNV